MIFPSNTEFNRKLPKQRFYENLSISASAKKLFVEQIKAIYWQNKLSEETISLKATDKVQEIEVFRIILNQKTIDESVLRLLDKGIPYHIIFILEYEEQVRLCTAYKEITPAGSCSLVTEYYYSEWENEETVHLAISGLTLEKAYEGFVRQIANEKIAVKSTNIKKDVEISLRIERLKKEIDRTEKLARKEKQPRKKFDLVDQERALQGELESLLQMTLEITPKEVEVTIEKKN